MHVGSKASGISAWSGLGMDLSIIYWSVLITQQLCIHSILNLIGKGRLSDTQRMSCDNNECNNNADT